MQSDSWSPREIRGHYRYSNRAMAHIKAESYGLAISDAESASCRVDASLFLDASLFWHRFLGERQLRPGAILFTSVEL